MPIVAHNSLPTFDGLRADGEPVLTRSEALSQDIRELHIGLLAGGAPGVHHAPPADRRGQGTAGVTPDMIRLCIGIEHIDDILADLEQALKVSAG